MKVLIAEDDPVIALGLVERVRSLGHEPLGPAADGAEAVDYLFGSPGEGPRRQELEQLAAGDGRIVLAGSQSDIAPFYCAFDVFVSAARFEPFGLAIIEAMGAGCPLITTSIHGTVEFVTDPRTLWMEPDRDGQLAVQLCKAAAGKRERFAYDMSRFTIARAVEEMDGFYRRVASTR